MPGDVSSNAILLPHIPRRLLIAMHVLSQKSKARQTMLWHCHIFPSPLQLRLRAPAPAWNPRPRLVYQCLHSEPHLCAQDNATASAAAPSPGSNYYCTAVPSMLLSLPPSLPPSLSPIPLSAPLICWAVCKCKSATLLMWTLN